MTKIDAMIIVVVDRVVGNDAVVGILEPNPSGVLVSSIARDSKP